MRASASRRIAVGIGLTLPLILAHCNRGPDPEVSRLIAQLGRQNPPNVRIAACYEFRRVGPRGRAAVPDLIECLADQDTYIPAMNALLAIGPGAALDPLVKTLGDSDRSLAAAAATVIGLFGREARSAIPELRRALEDPPTRAAAAAALEHINKKE